MPLPALLPFHLHPSVASALLRNNSTASRHNGQNNKVLSCGRCLCFTSSSSVIRPYFGCYG
jgi:hypothetical protein